MRQPRATPPPSSWTWLWRGLLLGGALGFFVALALDWYLIRGPGAISPDRNEEYGIVSLLLGFPFILLFDPAGRVEFVISTMLAWSTVWAALAPMLAWIVGRWRTRGLT